MLARLITYARLNFVCQPMQYLCRASPAVNSVWCNVLGCPLTSSGVPLHVFPWPAVVSHYTSSLDQQWYPTTRLPLTSSGIPLHVFPWPAVVSHYTSSLDQQWYPTTRLRTQCGFQLFLDHQLSYLLCLPSWDVLASIQCMSQAVLETTMCIADELYNKYRRHNCFGVM